MFDTAPPPARLVWPVVVAAFAGVLALRLMPFPVDNTFIGLVRVQAPDIAAGLHATYVILLFTTPLLVCRVLVTAIDVFVPGTHRIRPCPLPPYPPPADRDEPYLILGEQHHPRRVERVAHPTWLTIPERGLHTGVFILGAIGTGKTSACMYPYANQLLGFAAHDPERKLGGLVLDVKGDFSGEVRRILETHGRADDYIELNLEGEWRYNPLHNDLDAYAHAYGLASVINNLYGRGKEPFWEQAWVNLVKFIILLYQTLDGYVTLRDIYECAINPDKLAAKIRAGEATFLAAGRRMSITMDDYVAHGPALRRSTWRTETDGRLSVPASLEIEEALRDAAVPVVHEGQPETAEVATRRLQFEAVKRWFEHDWQRIENKLRTSIVEGISVFLSLFDADPKVAYTFCPPRECYDAAANADGRHGRPLPPLADLIEQGKVLAVNLPLATNPGLARAILVMIKQHFQRTMLDRIPLIAAFPDRVFRTVVLLGDECQSFTTVGEMNPSGDEKFYPLSRQARLIPILATQSLSSLRSLLPGESWRTLFQAFRTKVFLALSDDFTAQIAADLCGKADRLKPSFTLSEAGQKAGISLMTGKAAARGTTLSASKTYGLRLDHVFQPRTFMQLQNAQAIVLAYDGVNPHPPSYCYLKPHYLDVQTSYFDHRAHGRL